VLNTTLTLPPGRKLEVLCIGAHCDDIEIGCGGTVLALQQRYPDCRIHWLVLSSTQTRRKEALAGVDAFVAKPARGQVRVHDLPDGLLPGHFTDVKAHFEASKDEVSPDLVLTHCLNDRHQDHRVVAEVTWQTFRDHLIWEYEIPKYEGDLATPSVFIPLPPSIAKRKVALVAQTFASQSSKSWFGKENLEAVMRLRGLECRAASGYAEAFHCRKLLCDLDGPASHPTLRSKRPSSTPSGRRKQ